MNSAGRRVRKRKWLRENVLEIKRITDWINEGEKHVFSHIDRNDTIQMRPERIEAFGLRGERNRAIWKDYLIEHGVDSSVFVEEISSTKSATIFLPITKPVS